MYNISTLNFIMVLINISLGYLLFSSCCVLLTAYSFSCCLPKAVYNLCNYMIEVCFISLKITLFLIYHGASTALWMLMFSWRSPLCVCMRPMRMFVSWRWSIWCVDSCSASRKRVFHLITLRSNWLFHGMRCPWWCAILNDVPFTLDE